MERIYLGGSKISEKVLIVFLLSFNIIGICVDYICLECYGFLSTIILSVVILVISFSLGVKAIKDREIIKMLLELGGRKNER